MNPYLTDPDLTLYNGDALEVLRELPSESVHMCVTSPPFYGLRDYGTGKWEVRCPTGLACTGCKYCEGIYERTETCDHTPDAPEPIAYDNGQGQAYTTNNQNWNKKGRQYQGNECPKCGATRIDQQIGLEPTPEEWCAKLVEVFREVRRVLRSDGTCWIECGDSYNSGNSGGLGGSTLGGGQENQAKSNRHGKALAPGLKHKDLIGAPWLLAFALRADGWYLRSDIIWSRPNPMPESVTDRPTKSHSYVFLLSKSARYFWDAEAVREKFSPNTHSAGKNHAPGADDSSKEIRSRYNDDFAAALPKRHVDFRPPPQVETLDGLWECSVCGVVKTKTNESAAEGCGACGGALVLVSGETPRGPDGRRATHVKGQDGSLQHRDGERWPNSGRNIRSVWEIATQPYPEAHFATYPEELVRRCILAGSPLDGTILDPFGGSGTTALVARKHGRRSMLIELSESYCELAARRLQQLSLLAEPA
jgi:DNA modification methylase